MSVADKLFSALVITDSVEAGLVQASRLLNWPPFGNVVSVEVEWRGEAGDFVLRRDPDDTGIHGEFLGHRAAVEVKTPVWHYAFRWNQLSRSFDLERAESVA